MPKEEDVNFEQSGGIFKDNPNRIEHDNDADSKRVVSVGSDGTVLVNPANMPTSDEDTSFVSGDSPHLFNVNTDTTFVGNGTEFEIINDGPGNFTVAISADGVTFGKEVTMKQQETYPLDSIITHTIRLTHVSDSAYRIRAR